MYTRILLIDPDAALRGELAKLLRKEGREIFEAQTVAEAIPLLSLPSYDLAVVNGCLPDDDSMRLCEEIRRYEYAARIIFYSALYRDMKSFSRLISDIGVDRIVHKPASARELALHADELLVPDDVLDQDEDPTMVEFLREEREGYLKRLAERLSAIEDALNDLIEGYALREAFTALYRLVHQIHGSATSYGFELAGTVARAWDQELLEYLRNLTIPTPAAARRMARYMFEIKEAAQGLGSRPVVRSRSSMPPKPIHHPNPSAGGAFPSLPAATPPVDGCASSRVSQNGSRLG